MAADFCLKDCLRRYDMSEDSKTLCWKCANAYGDCEWTEVDPETGRVRFGYVPGWEVKRRVVKSNRYNQLIGTERLTVISCPKFRPDRTIEWERQRAAEKAALEASVKAAMEERERMLEKMENGEQ